MFVDGERVAMVNPPEFKKAFVGGLTAGMKGNKNPICIGSNAVGSYAAGGVAIDDVMVFNRALEPAEIAVYVGSKAPYGSSLVPGAQPDYDDLRVTEKSDVQPWDHHTHFEVIGPRPHSDTDLDGVVAYWRLDGTSDGKDVTGTYDSAVEGDAKSVDGRFGRGEGAISVSKGGGVKVTQSKSLQVPVGSAEVWVRADKCLHSFQGLLTKTDDKTSERFQVGVSGSQSGCTWSLTIGGGANQVYLKSPVPARLGVWTHVAASWDGQVARLYVNGEKKAESLTKSGMALPGAPLRIGIYPSANHYFNGAIDEVIIHNVARPADYFAKRARGLPRVRFLAHTEAYPATSGAYRFHDYKLWWGNKAAKALKPRIIGLDGKSTCDALLSPCLGYVGWWRFDRLDPSGYLDASSNRRLLKAGSKAVKQSPGHAGFGIDGAGDPTWSALTALPPLKTFTGEISTRLTGGSGISAASTPDSLGARNATGTGTRWSFLQTDGKHCHPSTEPAEGKNEWHRAAMSFDGSKARWYRDAAQRKEQSCSAVKAGGSKLHVNTSTKPTKGQIDDVRIMSRALAADELLHFPLATGSVGGK